jgi:hypothetical protein
MIETAVVPLPVVISADSYRPLERERRRLMEMIPPGQWRVLRTKDPIVFGRIWEREALVYGVSDSYLEEGMVFVNPLVNMALLVVGEQLVQQHFLWIEFNCLEEAEQLRAYSWGCACACRKMRHN